VLPQVLWHHCFLVDIQPTQPFVPKGPVPRTTGGRKPGEAANPSSPGKWPLQRRYPLPLNRHRQSNDDCLEGERENYQGCSVQYCVQQLCTLQCTHIWTDPRVVYWLDLAFLWLIVLQSTCVRFIFLGLFCVSLLVYVCFCCGRFSLFRTMQRDWLGRTSLKWPILCRVGRRTLTQSISISSQSRRNCWHFLSSESLVQLHVFLGCVLRLPKMAKSVVCGDVTWSLEKYPNIQREYRKWSWRLLEVVCGSSFWYAFDLIFFLLLVCEGSVLHCFQAVTT